MVELSGIFFYANNIQAAITAEIAIVDEEIEVAPLDIGEGDAPSMN